MKNPIFFLATYPEALFSSKALFSPKVLVSIGALALAISSSAQAACTYTITNNWGSGFTGEINVTNNTLGSFDKNKAISKTIFSVASPVKTESASSAYTSVLAKAGALPRDSVDRRIVNEVTNGSASGKGTFNNNANVGIIDNPAGVGGFPSYKAATALADSDADGIPDQWESNNGLNPNNASDGAQLHSSGYSWLELYLNGVMGERIQGVSY